MASMDVVGAGNAQAKVESELAKVQNALAAVKEARCKADDEICHLADERVSLLLKLGTCKEEVSAIRQRPLKRKGLWKRVTRMALT